MALQFSHVRVSTPDGNEAEFLVSGIPREFDDFEYYTAYRIDGQLLRYHHVRKEINLLTFYEKELHRLFDDSERISMDTVFAGKTMITKIGEDLRAKVQFVNTKISGQYDALRLTIINRHEGTVDSETLKFSDIIGMKGDRTPHVWDDGERVDWYIYKPTAYEYKLISDAVEDYISMYADQGYCFDSGMEMGGM